MRAEKALIFVFRWYLLEKSKIHMKKIVFEKRQLRLVEETQEQGVTAAINTNEKSTNVSTKINQNLAKPNVDGVSVPGDTLTPQTTDNNTSVAIHAANGQDAVQQMNTFLKSPNGKKLTPNEVTFEVSESVKYTKSELKEFLKKI